jgi:vitamin B12 transporter
MVRNILAALIASMTSFVAVTDTAYSLENVLVTGALSPRAELTSSVSVLDAQQIQALNKRTLADVLKTLPGILVEEQGGAGGLTAVSIRGGESNFTLVLLDGVPVNDPTNFRGGGFDFANLNSALVERIELVRGAQSAVYGSDALAGVINIITRQPEGGHIQDVRAEWGQNGFSDYGISALGKAQSVEYTLELSARDDGDAVEGSRRDSELANVRLAWQLSPTQRLTANYRYLDGERSSYPEQSGGPEHALFDDLDESDYEDRVMALRWEAKFGEAWHSALNLNRFEHEESYQSPGISPYSSVPPNAADTDFRRDQLQWVNTVQIATAYQLNLGADYRDEEGDSSGYLDFGAPLATDFDLDRSSKGVFADITATPVAGLLLQGSVRYDHPDDFDSETSVRAGARYDLTDNWSVTANWGEAYKLPSFFALGHALVGNPNLLPEQAESWDLGLSWRPSTGLLLQLTYFNNDYEDLVDFDANEFRNVNRKNIETSGYEFEARWQALDQLSFSAQGTYTDLDVKGEDTVLTGRPEWTAGAVMQWQLSERWQTALDYQYTGEQWATSRHTGMEVTEELADFHYLDWVLQWQATSAWQMQLSVDNLLEENYETAVGFPAPERELRLSVRFSH